TILKDATRSMFAFGFASNNQKLFAKKPPGERNTQVNLEKRNRILSLVRHCVRQKPGETFRYLKAVARHAFGQRFFGERQVVIPEIPILAGKIFDVWPHCDQASARREAAKRLIQRSVKR